MLLVYQSHCALILLKSYVFADVLVFVFCFLFAYPVISRGLKCVLKSLTKSIDSFLSSVFAMYIFLEAKLLEIQI